MIYLFLMLASWGLCFGFQHKIPMLHGKSKLIDSMLGCTFCTGFHSGYMVWLIWMGSKVTITSSGIVQFHLGEIVARMLVASCEGALYAFASASFCYMADSWTRYLESNSDPIDLEEDEE